MNHHGAESEADKSTQHLHHVIIGRKEGGDGEVTQTRGNRDSERPTATYIMISTEDQ